MIHQVTCVYFLRFRTTRPETKTVLRYQAGQYFIMQFLDVNSLKTNLSTPKSQLTQDKGACAHVPARSLKALFVHPEQWGM